MAGGEGEEGWKRSGIEVSTLQFGYDGQAPLFASFNLRVAPGSRCLLVGANGSGKRLTLAPSRATMLA
jgi:CCR4-NOT complex subunit CAF16